MTAMQVLQKGELKLGKFRVGAPFVSDSYKSKTPKTIKTVGETLLFVGGVVAIVAGVFTPPGWVLVAGGIATLAGRFVAKMFSDRKG